MKLKELLTEAGYGNAASSLSVEDAMREVGGVTPDTRRVESGNLFVAIRGQRIDGHTLIGCAAKRGAVAAVVEYIPPDLEGVIPMILIPDTRRAVARLSDAFYGHPTDAMRTVAVTGTNGKTTVAHLTEAILLKSGSRVGLLGTVTGRSHLRDLNMDGGDVTAHMTTPDPEVLYRLFHEMRSDGCDTVVFEATSHASALGKLDPILFDLLIFTNLSRDHLDFHGTMEAYFEAKAALLQHARRALILLDGSAIFGDPDGYASRLIERARCEGVEVYTASAFPEKKSDFLLTELRQSFDAEQMERGGLSFRLTSECCRRDFTVVSPLLGRYNASNLLLAASAALLLGVREDVIQSALLAFSGIPGRMERVLLPEGSDFSCFIDFAHTPDALENLLRAVHGFRNVGQRIVLLFGCGGDRDRSKRKEMAHIASRMADEIYITSDNSRTEDPDVIIGDILRGMDKERPYHVIYSREEAIRSAVLSLSGGDILILAGKGHESYAIDKNGIHFFSERQIVLKAASERLERRKNRYQIYDGSEDGI